MTRQNKAYLFAGFTILFWATSASAFKIGLRHIDYLQLLFISTATAFVFLFFVMLFQKKFTLLSKIRPVDISWSVLLGFLNPFLYYTVLFVAYALLPAQVAQPLNFVWPIVLVLLSIPILKQKLRLRNFLALLISFIGVVIISSEGSLENMQFSNPKGVFLALGSSLVWALYWLLNVKNRKDEVMQLFLNFFFALVFISVITYLFSSFEKITLNGILAGVYIGLFEMGITFVIWLKALKLAERTDKISNLIYITPFFSLIFIHLVLGEKIFITTLFGLFLIVAGIIIQQTNRKYEKQIN